MKITSYVSIAQGSVECFFSSSYQIPEWYLLYSHKCVCPLNTAHSNIALFFFEQKYKYGEILLMILTRVEFSIIQMDWIGFGVILKPDMFMG